MTHTLVSHDKDGDTVHFREIESIDSEVKALLRGIRRKGDDFIIAVGAPFNLHHILLACESRKASGRASSLNIGNHQGRLQHAG